MISFSDTNLGKGTRIDCLWTGEKKLQDPIYLPDIEQFQSNSKKKNTQTS